MAQFQQHGTDAVYAEIDSDGGHLAGIAEIAKASDAMEKFLRCEAPATAKRF